MTVVGRIEGGRYVPAKKTTKAQKRRFAEMLASRQPPRGQTDSTFFAGMNLRKQLAGGVLADRELDRITGEAMKRGFKPSADSIYMDSLADFDGDPKAFISMSDGRSHIRKVAEEKGVDAFEKDGTKIASGYRPPESDPMETSSNSRSKK